MGKEINFLRFCSQIPYVGQYMILEYIFRASMVRKKLPVKSRNPFQSDKNQSKFKSWKNTEKLQQGI